MCSSVEFGIFFMNGKREVIGKCIFGLLLISFFPTGYRLIQFATNREQDGNQSLVFMPSEWVYWIWVWFGVLFSLYIFSQITKKWNNRFITLRIHFLMSGVLSCFIGTGLLITYLQPYFSPEFNPNILISIISLLCIQLYLTIKLIFTTKNQIVTSRHTSLLLELIIGSSLGWGSISLMFSLISYFYSMTIIKQDRIEIIVSSVLTLTSVIVIYLMGLVDKKMASLLSYFIVIIWSFAGLYSATFDNPSIISRVIGGSMFLFGIFTANHIRKLMRS